MSEPDPAAPRLIKKYPNRRLYDTRSSTYITLVDGLDLRQFIPVADWQAKIPACGA